MRIKQTHISAARLNLLKEHVSPTHGLTERIKHENTISRIVYLLYGANIKVITFISLMSVLKGSCFELPNDAIHVIVISPFILINHKTL